MLNYLDGSPVLNRTLSQAQLSAIHEEIGTAFGAWSKANFKGKDQAEPAARLAQLHIKLRGGRKVRAEVHLREEALRDTRGIGNHYIWGLA